MALEEYKKKRDFAGSPEPRGAVQKSSGGPLRFVVQKHLASRLHYDLRLEAAGVLKSWAVPKGPSLNPDDKRLAVMVEDHPLDYGDFEGVVPEGNYGAGTVMVWDAGHYLPAHDVPGEDAQQTILKGLEMGHVSVCLSGEKLRGEFALVRTQAKGPDSWLLIKANDNYASSTNVLEQDRSALTGRTLEEIAEQAASSGRFWASPRNGQEVDLTDVAAAPMPRNVRPMLATTVGKAFDRAGWIFEIKWDGYRAIAEVEPGNLSLYSRRGLMLNAKYPEVVESLSKTGHSAVLDGEIVVVDENGVPRFELLQNYRPFRTPGLVYYVFDILWLDGHDLRGLPLIQRKDILEQILPKLPNLRFSSHVGEKGTDLFRVASERGLEGIVAKDASSIYESGTRSRKWLKIKALQSLEAVIGGFTEPRGGRKHLGALILGQYRDGELVYIGHTGGGSNDAALKDMRRRLDPLVVERSPFKKRPRPNAPVHWVEPIMSAEVTFTGWTDDGIMRQPILKGVKERHSAESIVPTSQPKPRLTNLSKVYWPEEGYTKGDVVAYYRDISSIILPHLRDRPESLHRHPNGITGESFYHKDVDDAPEWVQTVRVRSDSEDREINYVLCQNEATLLYMANLGCIEINPWLSKVNTLDRPDYLVIDLDPEGIGFEKVVEAAVVVRETLDEAGIASYCKTSGATGLHIYVPLGARYSYETSRRFAELVVHVVHGRLPHTTSIERSPGSRRSRVYLDHLQNRRGQTLAAPYSIRPQPGATVSAPLSWDEVRADLDPRRFTMRTMHERIQRIGDIFAPVLSETANLADGLERLSDMLVSQVPAENIEAVSEEWAK